MTHNQILTVANNYSSQPIRIVEALSANIRTSICVWMGEGNLTIPPWNTRGSNLGTRHHSCVTFYLKTNGIYYILQRSLLDFDSLWFCGFSCYEIFKLFCWKIMTPIRTIKEHFCGRYLTGTIQIEMIGYINRGFFPKFWLLKTFFKTSKIDIIALTQLWILILRKSIAKNNNFSDIPVSKVFTYSPCILIGYSYNFIKVSFMKKFYHFCHSDMFLTCKKLFLGKSIFCDQNVTWPKSLFLTTCLAIYLIK